MSMRTAPAVHTADGGRRQQIVVVGGGFAGFFALRYLQRHVPAEQVDLVLVNPTDYLLYSPLLPEVATGVIEARHIAVSLRRALPRVRLVLGRVAEVDLARRTVTVAPADHRRAETERLSWDRLALAPGSVTRQIPVPGVPEHGRALKTLVEAVFLRDHLLEQLDLADALPDTPEGRAERAALLTVVAVGAGYTGTELVAQTQRWLRTIERRWGRTRADDVRWVLVDQAPVVLPELGAELGRRTLALLRRRGVDVRLEVSVASADDDAVRLTDGTTVPTRTLVWGAGVMPHPLVGHLGLPTRRGRLVVDPELAVPGCPRASGRRGTPRPFRTWRHALAATGRPTPPHRSARPAAGERDGPQHRGQRRHRPGTPLQAQGSGPGGRPRGAGTRWRGRWASR